MFQKVLRIADRVVFSMLDAIMHLLAALMHIHRASRVRQRPIALPESNASS
jgi:hypothetical protein